MTEIIKIIKTIPGLRAGTFEKALTCPKFWEACVELPKVAINKISDTAMHWEITAHFMLDPLGVTKIPIEVSQDLLYKEDVAFKGEGKKLDFWTENSNATSKSEGILFFKPAGNDTKIMLQVTVLAIKAGFLDIAGLGKAMVVTRLKQELQKMITTLIEHVKSKKIKSILESC